MTIDRGAYLNATYQQMMMDLTYPVNPEGAVMDASFFKAFVCWHLTRCGWRKPNNTDGLALVEEFDDPQIKPRRVYGPGVYEDAVTWVPVTDPDDPLENLNNMSMAQIEHLPEDVKIEAKRRLGILPPVPDQLDQQGWSVSPTISIADAPCVDENDWSTT